MTDSVFLVDDDASILRGVSRLLRHAGFNVFPFQSAAEFLLQHDIGVPGCAVLDVDLGDFHGLELQRTIAGPDYTRPTIFITGRGDVPTSVQAMKEGAVDFLSKPIDGDVLVTAVRKAVELDRHNRERSSKRALVNDLFSSLTPREREVLTSVVDGRLNKQIADDLGIAEQTVKVHRARAMTKMNARSIVHLVRMLLFEGSVVQSLSMKP
jgi:RNA polymerase sigma factor (sigma-70 family)